MIGIPRIAGDGGDVVRVRAIDTTTNMVYGHQHLTLKTFCFLIEHERLGRKVLFDCGARKDLQVDIGAGVDILLQDANIPLDSIDTIIRSHWHWDHIGDCSKFPLGTKIVVSPRFKDAFSAGYPNDPECPFPVSNLESHEIDEVTFDGAPQIQGIRAHDFFVEQHAVGHIGALCRTTPTTYILLGGIPATSWEPCAQAKLIAYRVRFLIIQHCASDIQERVRAAKWTKSTSLKVHHRPFYRISDSESSIFNNAKVAQSTVEYLQALDARPDIRICFAHDNSLAEVAPLLNTKPQEDLNSWQANGLKDKSMWIFLKDLWLCVRECADNRY
ncbi:beta-lactamase-like protein [Aspergillus nidulans var. acristatus]